MIFSFFRKHLSGLMLTLAGLTEVNQHMGQVREGEEQFDERRLAGFL